MEDFERQVRDRKKKDITFIVVSIAIVTLLVVIGITMMVVPKKSANKKVERTPAQQEIINELQNSNSGASLTIEQKKKIMSDLLDAKK